MGQIMQMIVKRKLHWSKIEQGKIVEIDECVVVKKQQPQQQKKTLRNSIK